MIDGEKLKKHLVSKIVALASLLFVVITLITSIIGGVNLPRSSSLASFDDTSFTGLVMDEHYIYYSTKTGVAKNDFDNNEIISKNLVDEINTKFSLATYDIFTIRKVDDEKTLVVSKTQEKSYFFLLNNDNLSLDDSYAEIDWQFQELGIGNGHLVVAATTGNIVKLFNFDLSSLSSTPVSSGYVYKTTDEDDDTYTLSRTMRNFSVRQITVTSDTCYIVHSDGILFASLDFEYNCFGDLDLTDSSVKDKYGIISNKSGSITLYKDKFDGSKYTYYQGIGVSDGYYSERFSNYYLFTANSQALKVKDADVRGKAFPDSLASEEISSMSFNSNIANSACLHMVSDVAGYVTYQNNGDISRISFKSDIPQIEFTVDASTGIDIITESTNGDMISIIYRNSVESESGKGLGKTMNVSSLLGGQGYRSMMIVSIILCAVFAIVLVFALLCSFKEGFEEKFIATFKRVIKCRWIYIAMLPSLILLGLFCYYPAIASIGLSFFNYTKEKPVYIWNNFAHYKYIFTDPVMLNGWKNMFLFLVVDIVTAIVPPLIFAFFLTVMKPKKLSNVTRTILFFTGIIPGIASNLIWKEGILGTYGVINSAIKAAGGNPFAFLTTDSTAKWMIMLVGFPYVGSYLIFYGGMMNIPSSYYEAAELEGAGIFRRFVQIDVPLIFPQIKYVFICSIIASLQNFARIQAITDGDFDTAVPVTIMYNEIVDGNYGRASAIASIIFVLLFFATFFTLKKKKKEMDV